MGLQYPRVQIDRARLAHNARVLLERCSEKGISVSAVTKVTAAHPLVVQTLAGFHFHSLADSRISNLRRVRGICPDAELMLLRMPPPSRAAEVVRWADMSLNSELTTLRALDSEAGRADVIHGVVLMVDLGDLREGVWKDRLAGICDEVGRMSHLRVRGLGTNLACYGGVRPTRAKMMDLLACRDVATETLGHDIEFISGGNSANWQILETGDLPEGINHLRVGEALLLGNESVDRIPIPGMHDDVFTLSCEVIESQVKPSMPIGDLGQDAFGNTPQFEDRGSHHRAIVAVGRQDVVPEGLRPEMEGVCILGASSDHMILDVEDAREDIRTGDVLNFTVRGYSALLAVFTSQYVQKTVVEWE